MAWKRMLPFGGSGGPRELSPRRPPVLGADQKKKLLLTQKQPSFSGSSERAGPRPQHGGILGSPRPTAGGQEAQGGVGTRPSVLPKAAPHGCPVWGEQVEARGGGAQTPTQLSFVWGRRRTDSEPKRKDTCPSEVWVARGPQPGAGTLRGSLG